MRIRPGVGILVLSVLGVGTFFATRSLLARAAPGDGSRPVGRDQASEPGVTAVLHGESLPVSPPGAPSIVRGSMRRFHAEAIANVIHVTAQTRMTDARPEAAYVWAVRVYDADDHELQNVLFERRYDEQSFTLPAGERVEPSFDDILEVPLPPGTYIVELAAEGPHPADAPALADAAARTRAPIGPKGTVRVTLGP